MQWFLFIEGWGLLPASYLPRGLNVPVCSYCSYMGHKHVARWFLLWNFGGYLDTNLGVFAFSWPPFAFSALLLTDLGNRSTAFFKLLFLPPLELCRQFLRMWSEHLKAIKSVQGKNSYRVYKDPLCSACCQLYFFFRWRNIVSRDRGRRGEEGRGEVWVWKLL